MFEAPRNPHPPPPLLLDCGSHPISTTSALPFPSAPCAAGLCIVTFLLFTGFLMPRNSIPAWWTWMYYFNPLQYATTALTVNEMLSGSYDLVRE